MTIWEICENAIKDFCEANNIEYAAMRYIPPGGVETLPDEYIVYDMISDPNNAHYSNRPVSTDYRIQFDYMAREQYRMAEIPPKIEDLLIEAGFLMQGNARIRFDDKSGHWYWQKDFKKRMRRKK